MIAGEAVVVTMTAGRTYHQPFDAQAGQVINASTTSVYPNAVDPVLLVVHPDGTPLAFNDDAGDETLDASIANYAIPESGTYELVVSHANGGSEGNIEILINIQ